MRERTATDEFGEVVQDADNTYTKFVSFPHRSLLYLCRT
jgi:hypothetical protein